ncbi:MAG: 4-oxalocrotonate tautomerase family protein [Chloroflexi bacterium]|nr:4-oxalocrotonate tautomerase family protein [Chloroflexota bacterium]
MAVVTVEAWAGRTVEQKRRLVAAITSAMVEHFGSNPQHLHVIIHEVPKDDWGRGGVLSSDADATPADGRQAGTLGASGRSAR